MRAILVVLCLLAVTTVGSAADRSFTLGEHQFNLDFPPEFKFSERKEIDGIEFVIFESEILQLMFMDGGEYTLEGVGMMDTEDYFKAQSERGQFYLKAVEEGEFTLFGGCGEEKGLGHCYYFIQKAYREYGKWLLVKVNCAQQSCGDAVMRAAGRLIENLGEQLRYR